MIFPASILPQRCYIFKLYFIGKKKWKSKSKSLIHFIHKLNHFNAFNTWFKRLNLVLKKHKVLRELFTATSPCSAQSVNFCRIQYKLSNIRPTVQLKKTNHTKITMINLVQCPYSFVISVCSKLCQNKHIILEKPNIFYKKCV